MRLKRALGGADYQAMPISTRRLSDERGYTLVELLVASFVIVVGMAGAFTMLDGANKTTVTNNARMGATNLARELLEDARAVDYDTLTPAGVVGTLQAKSGTSGTPWKIERRGIEYTVSASVCTFDDPKDNIAATPPDNVCTPQAPVPAAAGTLQPEIQPDDFRRVTIKLDWNKGSGTRTLTQVFLINNPSGGLGPRITKFHAPPDNVNQLVSGSTAIFPTTTTTAGSVRWNSDGSPNGSGDSTGGPTTWTTSWQLGTPAAGVVPPATGPWPAQYDPNSTVFDGTYTVTAQAFDDRGIAGDSRAAVLPLNRSLPITVTGFEVGRNFNDNALEFRWSPNPERDIIGYRVYDVGNDGQVNIGQDTLICETDGVQKTSCQASTSMPSEDRDYGVVALDRQDITDTSSAIRNSVNAQVLATSSTEPARPLGLLVLPDLATGLPKLMWSHPNTAAVRFFRIYRYSGTGGSCCTRAQRYSLTPDSGTTWIDPQPASGLVHYVVTAVGPGLNESQGSNEFDWLTP